MIKLIFQVALALFLIFSTVACGKGNETKTAQKSVPVDSPEPIPPRKVATPTVVVPDDQIQVKVIELVADQTGRKSDTIKPSTQLHNDLKMDDEDHIGLVMQLEDTFGFAISDDDAKRLSTVAAISDYIKFRRSAK